MEKSACTISRRFCSRHPSPHHPIHTTENYQNISSQFYHIVELSKNKEDFAGLKTFSVFLDILYHYVKTDNCTDIQAIASPLSSHLDIAIEYIKYYYHKNISVSEIAQHLGIRREYFCSLFKRQFGISLVQFVRSYRLKVSSTLLISSKNPLRKSPMKWDTTTTIITPIAFTGSTVSVPPGTESWP